MRWVLTSILAGGLTATTVVAEGLSANAGEVVIRERLWPTHVVKSASGRCGSNLYRIVVRHEGNTHLLLLEANGRSIAKAEVAKVYRSVPAGLLFYEPSVAECFWDKPNGRMRVLVGGPQTSKPMWLSFEVSPEGLVSNIRPD